MIHIAGGDLSTKRIGWAPVDGCPVSIIARAGSKDPYRRLSELRRDFGRNLLTYPPRPTLVVLEGYLRHSPGVISIIRQAEVGGQVRTDLFELAIPWVDVDPHVLKRFATGRANAPKELMIAAAFERSGLELNDDEADAFHLRRLGRAAYGQETATEDHELEVLASIDWPTIDPGSTP